MLLGISVCFITTAIVISLPVKKETNVSAPSGGRSAYDKKQIEQAKKASILRRFVS